jgi:hypothetical protein
MPRYGEFRFWSPMLGRDAARISMVGRDNQEYFAIVEADVPDIGNAGRRRSGG